MKDVLDQMEDLCVSRGTGNVATILTNGGLKRVVCETPAETVEEKVEIVKEEMLLEYPDAVFDVTYTEE